MKKKILRELAKMQFKVIAYFMAEYELNTLEEMAEKLADAFPCKEDLPHVAEQLNNIYLMDAE